MYADYFLKFPDEAAANAVLYTPAPEVEDGEPQPPTPKFANIDTLGILYDTTDPENPVPMDGWHVNVRVVLGQEDGEPLVPFCVYPMSPRRVWAGPMYPVHPPVGA